MCTFKHLSTLCVSAVILKVWKAILEHGSWLYIVLSRSQVSESTTLGREVGLDTDPGDDSRIRPWGVLSSHISFYCGSNGCVFFFLLDNNNLPYLSIISSGSSLSLPLYPSLYYSDRTFGYCGQCSQVTWKPHSDLRLAGFFFLRKKNIAWAWKWQLHRAWN